MKLPIEIDAGSADYLRKCAEGHRKSAKNFEGCTWVGDMSPSAAETMKADALERAARELDLLQAQIKELREVIDLGLATLPALEGQKGYDKIVAVWLARAKEVTK